MLHRQGAEPYSVSAIAKLVYGVSLRDIAYCISGGRCIDNRESFVGIIIHGR